MLFAEWRASGVLFTPLEALRAAALEVATGDEPSAQSLLTETLAQVEAQLAASRPPDEPVLEPDARAALQADAKRLRDALAPAPQLSGLVRIGPGKH